MKFATQMNNEIMRSIMKLNSLLSADNFIAVGYFIHEVKFTPRQWNLIEKRQLESCLFSWDGCSYRTSSKNPVFIGVHRLQKQYLTKN